MTDFFSDVATFPDHGRVKGVWEGMEKEHDGMDEQAAIGEFGRGGGEELRGGQGRGSLISCIAVVSRSLTLASLQCRGGAPPTR